MDMARIAEVAVTALVRAIDGDDPANRPAAGGVVADISKVAMELIIRRSSAANNKKQTEDKKPTAGEHTS